MAWPSGTKAGTTNVDAGSDKPALARPDIKQNIDNVNSIIDTFDIASPSNGDILVYNSTSGAWETSANSAGTNIALITRNTTSTNEENVSGNIYRLRYTEVDPNSFVTAVDNFQIQLAAGSYLFDCFEIDLDQSSATVTLYDETNTTDLQDFTYNEMGNVGEGIRQGKSIQTLAGTTNISFRVDDADVNNRNGTGFSITIIKI